MRTSLFRAEYFTRERMLPLAGFFAVLFGSALIGQYIYFGAHTSPALIWPPAGIALAIVILYGYRAWPAIALASFCASLVAQTGIVSTIGGTIASTVVALLGAYILKKLAFDPSMRTVRDAIALLVVAIFVTMLEPTIGITIVQALAHPLSASPTLVWTRTWGGWMLSVLILTPLITTWVTGGTMRIRIPRADLPERLLIFFFLILVSYLLFWTYVPPINTWLALLFLAPFLWLSLRTTSRSMTLGLFLASMIAFAGTIIAHPNHAATVSQQLLSDEVFMALIAGVFLVIACVVTERRTANAEVKEHVELLQIALQKISAEDKTKNEFIAVLAHELRNPLAPIVSTLELFKLKERSAASRKMIENIEAHVQTMGRLLDDLLDISRVSQKKFELKKEPVKLSTLIDRAVETTHPLVESKGHTLKVLLPKADLWLNVDPVRFEQILVNLLNNAAKYTAPGGRIELKAVYEDMLTLIVRDTGCGITAENLPHVFEPFRRESISRRSGGLGIGLSITKQLVEMHGGTISAFSEGSEKGTTFTVRVPIPHSVDLPEPVVKKRRMGSSVRESSPFKILIVDDNVAAAQGLSKLLEHKGHEVAQAYNGRSAIHAAESFMPEVVLLDIGLPDIDGYQVARQLRKKHPEPLTLVALTGYGQAEDKKKAMDTGFNHHLTKPVGIEDVEAFLVTVARS